MNAISLKRTPKISVVIPVYSEASNIEVILQHVQSCLSSMDVDTEIIFVDDGSNDQSWSVIERLAVQHPEVRGICFSRNFGEEYALMAGLQQACGDAVITIDADMQHPPEIIPIMIQMWRDEGVQVVDVIKRVRQKESLFHRINSRLFYLVFKYFTGLDINNSTDYKLLDRKVVDSILKFNEKNRFYRGITSWVGYQHRAIEITIADRANGETKWNIDKLVGYALNNIFNYSSKPLVIIAVLGLLFMLSAVLLFIISIARVVTHTTLAGFPTIILLLLFIGGIMVTSLSLIGIYLSKVLDEVKARPMFIVKDSVNTR